MPAVGRKSRQIIENDLVEIVWEHSHVVVDDQGLVRTFCVYEAPNEEAVLAHSSRLGQHRIDSIDEQLLSLVDERARMSLAISQAKGGNGNGVGHDPSREHALLDKARATEGSVLDSEELEQVMEAAGVKVLDGDDCEVHGLGFAGVKGFGGGFGRHTLEPWGEDGIKRFVMEAVEEGLKLEKALARLHTPQRIAVLHYAPIQDTVEGEPSAIFPFLGSSRLEEPLNRYPVTLVLHGHAHHGRPEGKTQGGVPVYNVGLPVLRQAFGERPPVRVLEVPAVAPVETATGKQKRQS